MKEETYLVLCRETGESGTPHIPGYVCFHKKKRLFQLKKLVTRVHWEVMYKTSTPQEAAVYCK